MGESGKDGAIMEIASLGEAVEWQARHAEEAGAPITARIVRALLAIAETDTATGRRIANWQGLSLEDALPLRVAGAIHHLHLTEEEPRLAPVYGGLQTDQPSIDRLIAEVAEVHDHALLPWLDHPPQTNEAGRSASFMAALLWLSERFGSKFALFEIGASAGINTMLARYHYALGGVKAGPELSRMAIAPEWRGAPPPDASVEIVSAKGCDIAPVDLADPAQALRLKAYVWPEATQRMARLDTAIALAGQMPPELARMDAGKFVRLCLAEELEAGVCRVLCHSIMWQYMPQETRAAITTAMKEAGAAATAEHPIAWIALETNRETFRHELTVRYWPGGGDAAKLAEAHPHGAWVEWLA